MTGRELFFWFMWRVVLSLAGVLLVVQQSHIESLELRLRQAETDIVTLQKRSDRHFGLMEQLAENQTKTINVLTTLVSR